METSRWATLPLLPRHQHPLPLSQHHPPSLPHRKFPQNVRLSSGSSSIHDVLNLSHLQQHESLSHLRQISTMNRFSQNRRDSSSSPPFLTCTSPDIPFSTVTTRRSESGSTLSTPRRQTRKPPRNLFTKSSARTTFPPPPSPRAHPLRPFLHLHPHLHRLLYLSLIRQRGSSDDCKMSDLPRYASSILLVPPPSDMPSDYSTRYRSSLLHPAVPPPSTSPQIP